MEETLSIDRGTSRCRQKAIDGLPRKGRRPVRMRPALGPASDRYLAAALKFWVTWFQLMTLKKLLMYSGRLFWYFR